MSLTLVLATIMSSVSLTILTVLMMILGETGSLLCNQSWTVVGAGGE